MERNSNIIGLSELELIADKLGILKPSIANLKEPDIPLDLLNKFQTAPKSYILILGWNQFKDGSILSLNKMREHFGYDPAEGEPCFYNQDWYLKDDFANANNLKFKWYLLHKEIDSASRGVLPNFDSLDIKGVLPNALLCSYTFFAYYFLRGIHLWKNDFVWCKDVDHNGDQIYVGKYIDPSGTNKNGFEIHRHLKISKQYGIISCQ